MEEKKVLVDLTPEKPTRILSGKDVGERARIKFKLDDLDNAQNIVEVNIPVPVVTSSFILGMFSKSVKALGYDNFFKKYHFVASDAVLENLEINAKYSLQEGSVIH